MDQSSDQGQGWLPATRLATNNTGQFTTRPTADNSQFRDDQIRCSDIFNIETESGPDVHHGVNLLMAQNLNAVMADSALQDGDLSFFGDATANISWNTDAQFNEVPATEMQSFLCSDLTPCMIPDTVAPDVLPNRNTLLAPIDAVLHSHAFTPDPTVDHSMADWNICTFNTNDEQFNPIFDIHSGTRIASSINPDPNRTSTNVDTAKPGWLVNNNISLARQLQNVQPTQPMMPHLSL